MNAPTLDLEKLDVVGKQIVDTAFKIHSALGPGLLESVYETCLIHELTKRGLIVVRQLGLPIRYDELLIESGLRFDLLVNDSVIIEVKAVEKIIPVSQAQLLSYLKLTGCRLGFLINFHTPIIKNGIKRMVL